MSVFDRIPGKRRSVFRNALAREYGLCGRDNFERGVSRYFHAKQLLQDPDIASPHRKSISSLSVDSSGRFLLAGCADATVTVYDISKWGQSKSVGHRDSAFGGQCYAPVAKSVKVPAVPDILRLPAGHSSSVTYTQWYPTDAGAFLSGSSDGTILLWDTHRMKPVLRVHPFRRDDSASWISAHLRTGGDRSLIAAGSWFESEIKLVDIRSGASSHQLVGHSGGISALEWSGNNPHVVASGSRDSTVRLWDIRKSGSRACVTVLDRERVMMPGGCANHSPPSSSSPSSRSTRVGYASDYSHLRRRPTEPAGSRRRTSGLDGTPKRRKRDARSGMAMAIAIAPNNYDAVQHQSARSHASGHVSGLSFFGSGHYLCSVSGLDGELLVWDLRSGCVLPSKFVVPGTRSSAAGAPRQRRTPILAEGSGYTDSSNGSSTIWIGRRGVVHGFSTEGGTPKQTLEGHLTSVTSVEAMEPGGKLLSGSSDGMILAWGRPRDAPVAPAAEDAAAQDDRDDW